MEFAVVDQSDEEMDAVEWDELIYYSDSDELYDAHMSNVQSDADELNNLQQVTSNTPDDNANNKQQTQPVAELDEDYEMPFSPNDNPICNENEQRAQNGTRTDSPKTIDLISENNEIVVKADVSGAPRVAENVADPSLPRDQRPKTKINKYQKSTHAVQSTKKYNCGQCEFSAKGKWDLDIHIRTHSGERPHGCKFCEKRFIRKSHLKHHVNSVHSELFEFHCSKCRLGFQEKALLMSHETHCSKKQFVCDFCNRVHNHRGHLAEHIRMKHSNETPFPCFVCKKGFKTKYHLQRHIRSCH